MVPSIALPSSARIGLNPLPWVLTARGLDLTVPALRSAFAEIATTGFAAIHADPPAGTSPGEYAALLDEFGLVPAPGYFSAAFHKASRPTLVRAAAQHAAFQAALGNTEVFIRWLECAAQGRAPQIHGDGSATIDFVYVGDIARANVLAMKSDRSDAVYNVASGTETSLLDLWRGLQRVTGAHAMEPEFHPVRTVAPLARRLADTRRAKAEIGFETEVGLDEGLRNLAAWRRAQLAVAEVVG